MIIRDFRKERAKSAQEIWMQRQVDKSSLVGVGQI